MLPPRTTTLRIGLLGGSFNPAHLGHVHLSKEALKRLNLDQVWWLVSPQNPLKSAHDMAPLEERLAAAERLITDPRIKVSALELLFTLPQAGESDFSNFLLRKLARNPVRALTPTLSRVRERVYYTLHTITFLKTFYPRAHFVWLMGADSWIELPRWYQWRALMQHIPMAIFDRPGYTISALNSYAARCYARFRLPSQRMRCIADLLPPAWCFITMPTNPISATALRKERKKL